MAKTFDHGQIVMTRAISDRMQDNKFASFVYNSLGRHLKCDWGNLSKEDWKTNEIALKNGDDRLFSAYIDEETEVKIWIITEWDRSVTTILFPSDY